MKVAVLTETRGDYGIYYPLLEALHEDERFELQLLVTGMHYSYAHGMTVSDIELSFKPYPCAVEADILFVLGDRLPMLEVAMVVAYQNIPVAHIQGGDKSGTIDEPCRHAITRFAHIHFPSLQEHADRLIKMGEEPWRITTVGPLGIYAMSDVQFIPKEKLLKDLGLNDKPIILVIQHPVSYQEGRASKQMWDTLEAVNNPAWQPVVIYPNNDPGSEAMIEVIERYPYAKFKSLPYLQFLSLMKISSVIVGNSSCAIVDAPLFGLPAVNIGSRQQGREYFRPNKIININYGDDIRSAIEYSIRTDHPIFPMPVECFNGVDKILEVLSNLEINERLLQKHLTY